MCSKQLREAPKLKTSWRVTGARFSRQHRHDPLPHVFSVVFSVVGLVHLSSVLSLPLALYLRLVLGLRAGVPSRLALQQSDWPLARELAHHVLLEALLPVPVGLPRPRWPLSLAQLPLVGALVLAPSLSAADLVALLSVSAEAFAILILFFPALKENWTSR